MVTLGRPVVRQLIRAADITNTTGFLLGDAGYGQLARLNDISDATNYSTIIGNQDATNGLALQLTYGPTASATLIAQFTKLGLALAQIGASADPGSGKTALYMGTDNHLYIFPTGGSATRMATFAEVSGSGFVPATPVTAQVTGSDYTLTTSAADVTGLSVSLTAGKWLVVGTFDWSTSGAGDVGVGAVFVGSLVTAGGTATITKSNAKATFAPVGNGERATTTQTWYVSVTATTTAKVQAQKTGGTGSSILSQTNSTLMAFQIGN